MNQELRVLLSGGRAPAPRSRRASAEEGAAACDRAAGESSRASAPHRARFKPTSLDELPKCRQPLLDSDNVVARYFGEALKALQAIGEQWKALHDDQGRPSASADAIRTLREEFGTRARKIQGELDDPAYIPGLEKCEHELPGWAHLTAFDDLAVQYEQFSSSVASDDASFEHISTEQFAQLMDLTAQALLSRFNGEIQTLEVVNGRVVATPHPTVIPSETHDTPVS